MFEEKHMVGVDSEDAARPAQSESRWLVRDVAVKMRLKFHEKGE